MKERPILFSSPMVRAILEGRKTQTRRVVALPSWATRDGLTFDNFDEPCSPAPGYGPEFVTGDWGPCPRAFGCPYGVPGDRLWVRETSIITPKHWDNSASFTHLDTDGNKRWVQYLATGPNCEAAKDYGLKISPSIFMPRWASRITLEITDVRVQRVQEISERDAEAEGVLSDTGLECACGWIGWEDSKGVTRTDSEGWEFLCPDCGEACAHHPLDEQNQMEYRKLWDSINGKTHPWVANLWVWALTFRRLP